MKTIVKVQVPLASSTGEAGVLVYNEDRSIMQELPLRSKEELSGLLEVLDGEPKGYFYAEEKGKGLILTGVAPWQDW